MSDNPPLFRPTGDDITALCAALRGRGLIDGGADVELRLRAAFARMAPRPKDGVGQAVCAVCLKSAERDERAAFVDAIGPWLGTLRPAVTPTVQRRPAPAADIGASAPAAPEAEPTPPLEPEPEPTRRPWAAGLALVGLVATAAVWQPWSGDQPPPSSDAGPTEASDGGVASDIIADTISDPISDAIPDAPPADAALPDANPDAPDLGPLAPRPTLASAPETRPGAWPTADTLAALGALLFAALLLGVRAWTLERLRRDDPIELPPPTRPPAPLPPPPNPPPRILPPDADTRLAAGSGRTTADPERRALDVPASVRATAGRAGKIPTLRFRPLRRPEPLHLWIDWPARSRTPTLARAVDELHAALKRGGVAATAMHFTGLPDRLVADGRRLSVDGLAADRSHTRVAIITDGRSLMRASGRSHRRLLDRLTRWRDLAVFVFGRLDPEALAEHLGRCVEVHPGASLLEWLVQVEPTPPPVVDPREMQIWAGACALAPCGATDDDAFELRRALGLKGAPPTAIEALRSDAGGGLEWGPEARAERLGWLSTHAPEMRGAALRWWRARFDATRSQGGTRDRRWETEAAVIGLWAPDRDEPTAAQVAAHAATLERLADPRARALIGHLAPADNPPHEHAIRLPWRRQDIPDPETRRRLRRLGLAAAVGGLPEDEYERPPRSHALLGLAFGLLAAVGLGLLIAPRAETTVDAPCVRIETASDGLSAEVWRCGTAVAARPTHPSWPQRSAVGLFIPSEEPPAAELALALLDSGAADAIWWGALPSADAADQRIALVRGVDACPAQATACVRADRVRGLTAALGEKPMPLSEVWPEVERGEGWLLGGISASGAGLAPHPSSALDSAPNQSFDAATAPASPNDAAHLDGLARLDRTLPLHLRSIEVVDAGPDVFTIRINHPQALPLKPRLTYRNGLLLVSLPGARWPFRRRLPSLDDQDIAVIEATKENQLYIRPHNPPPTLTPRLNAYSTGLIITFDRSALRPTPDANPARATEERDASIPAPHTEVGASSSDSLGLRHPIHHPHMIRIPAGTYTVGSLRGREARLSFDIPRRQVTLSQAYFIAETEVTQAQYQSVMDRNPSWFQGSIEDGQRPVERVSWFNAAAYCNRLSELEGRTPAYSIDGEEVIWDRGADGYRLPTEAEWEVAARAGTSKATYAGDLDIRADHDAPTLDAIAWYGGNSGSNHPEAVDSSRWEGKQQPHTRASTHPVKRKQPNAWGIYDILGNVEEWTWDWWAHRPPSDDVDPEGPPKGVRRVIRGGSFFDIAYGLRAADRLRWHPSDRSNTLGFRPVRSARPPDRRARFRNTNRGVVSEAHMRPSGL